MDFEELKKIKEVMTPLPHTVQADEYLSVAASTMELASIRHLPVVNEDGSLLGIVTDRDIKLAKYVEEHFKSDTLLSVGQICTKEPFTVDAEETLDVVALNMAERRIGSAIVMRDNQVLGIFTATDACRWLGTYLRSQKT